MAPSTELSDWEVTIGTILLSSNSSLANTGAQFVDIANGTIKQTTAFVCAGFVLLELFTFYKENAFVKNYKINH